MAEKRKSHKLKSFEKLISSCFLLNITNGNPFRNNKILPSLPSEVRLRMTGHQVFQRSWLWILLVFLFLYAAVAAAQDRDYHREESPSISWNGINLYDSRSAGAAGISLFATGSNSPIANPALLQHVDKINIALSYAMLGTTAYQYAFLNTGPFYSADKIYEFNDRFSSISISIPTGGLTIGAGWYKESLMNLPDFASSYGSEYSSGAYFSGEENSFYMAAAYEIAAGMQIGLKITYTNGNRSSDLLENWDSTITMQNEKYDFDYFTISGGASWKASDRIQLSASIDYPLRGKMDETIFRSFDATSYNGAYIADEYKATDDLYRPVRMKLGILAAPFGTGNLAEGESLLVAVEISQAFWSSYRYIVFGEELDRNFDDTTTLAAGLEVPAHIGSLILLIRAGYRYDPQPVAEPDTILHWLTFGAGAKIWVLTFDLSASYIFGSLPEWSPENFTVVATLGFEI